MNDFDLRVGDVVRFREWDDMVAEFGMVGDSVGVPYHFTREMRYLCGHLAKVRRVSKDDDYDCTEVYLSSCDDDPIDVGPFAFSLPMFEPASIAQDFETDDPMLLFAAGEEAHQ